MFFYVVHEILKKADDTDFNQGTKFTPYVSLFFLNTPFHLWNSVVLNMLHSAFSINNLLIPDTINIETSVSRQNCISLILQRVLKESGQSHFPLKSDNTCRKLLHSILMTKSLVGPKRLKFSHRDAFYYLCHFLLFTSVTRQPRNYKCHCKCHASTETDIFVQGI